MPTSPGNASKPVENEPIPRIIPRSEHPISRKNIDREALKVLYRLRDSGYTAYLVGGGVRDLYLGKTPKDFDISTNARPGQLRKVFRNSRLIGRRFRLVQVFFHGGKIIEVSTFRCRSEFDLNGDREKVLAANNTFGSPSDDAFRRDLTINSLFYEIENQTIIDYTDGVNDLEKEVIRFIGDPRVRIQRDPARMLRVIRHAARNSFAIEPETWNAVCEQVESLQLCPVSRIRDELMKDLRSAACRDWTELALDSGIFYMLFPFYTDLIKSSAGRESRKLLLGIQESVGRLHSRGMVLPDQLLFALILLPWAAEEFQLLDRQLKGGEFHRLLKEVRDRINEIFGPMSIKRALKESVALQLVNLPQFTRYAAERRWPKWLKKKSYFRDCDLFFRIYSEATGSRNIPEQYIGNLKKQLATEGKAKKPARRKGKQRKKKRGGPSFANKKQGSIFGLKK